MFWFDYALIRYMPNPKRGEIINLGLVIFNERGTDIRMLESSTKMRLIGSQIDLIELQNSMQNMSLIADTLEGKYKLLSSFNGAVFLSDKGRFSLDDLGQYEAIVSRLFIDLVKPISIHNEVRHSRLTTQLRDKFSTLNMLAKDASELSRHKIVPNYPIKDTGLSADFLLKNGIFHLSEVVDFNVNDTQSKLRETALKIMTFATSKEELGEPVACYFVYSASSEKDKFITNHLNMAEKHSDKLFNLSSKDEEKSYFRLISEFAGMAMPSIH